LRVDGSRPLTAGNQNVGQAYLSKIGANF